MVPRYCFVVCLATLSLFLNTEADRIPKSRHVRYAPAYIETEHDAPPNYAYEYGVNDPHTGDNKSQWERRYGDVVKGSYSLAEPDGTIRVVNYAADAHSGFNAVVKRYGTAIHPDNLVAKPIVVAPIANNALPEKETVYIPTRIIHSAIPVVAPVIVPNPSPVIISQVSPPPLVKLPPPPPPPPLPAPFTIKIQRKSKGDIFGPGKKLTYYIYVDPASLDDDTNYLKPTFTRKTKGKYSTGWVQVRGKGEKLSRQFGKALTDI